jgi:hypothetical protein
MRASTPAGRSLRRQKLQKQKHQWTSQQLHLQEQQEPRRQMMMRQQQ